MNKNSFITESVYNINTFKDMKIIKNTNPFYRNDLE